MALVSTSATKTTTVPFDMLGLSCVNRHDFLDIMPLKDLSILREGSDIIKSLSNLRGEIVEVLKVQTDTVKELYCGSNRFFEIMNRRFNSTPLNALEVHMGPDICPEVLLSKMDGQYYTDLYLTGKYDWKNVVAFLHAGVKCVKMNDYMSLPAENMKEFFDTLFRFKVKFVWIVTDNYEESWLFSAQKTFNDAGITAEYVSYKERYCPEVIVTSGNEKIRIIGNTFVDGPEFMPDSDDSDYEEEYDEFEYDEFY